MPARRLPARRPPKPAPPTRQLPSPTRQKASHQLLSPGSEGGMGFAKPRTAMTKTDAETGPSHVELDELSHRIEDEDTSFVLLNVLPRAAFEAGRIPGSLN